MFESREITTDAEYRVVVDLIMKNKDSLGIDAVSDEGDKFRFSTNKLGYVSIRPDLKISSDELETVIDVREQQSDFGLQEKVFAVLETGLSERVTRFATDSDEVVEEVNV